MAIQYEFIHRQEPIMDSNSKIKHGQWVTLLATAHAIANVNGPTLLGITPELAWAAIEKLE
jgi:hypothetical protein